MTKQNEPTERVCDLTNLISDMASDLRYTAPPATPREQWLILKIAQILLGVRDLIAALRALEESKLERLEGIKDSSKAPGSD